MAISKLTYPNAGGAAVYPDDYNKQNALLLALLSQGNNGLKLTEWTTTAVLAKIALGAYMRHNGAFYIVTDADYTIQGTAPSADGTYYIKLIGTGDTITAEWVTSASGFTFNVVKNGWYNSSDEQLIDEGVIKSGSTYYNFKFIDKELRTLSINQLGNMVSAKELALSKLTASGTIVVGAVTLTPSSTELDVNKIVKTTGVNSTGPINGTLLKLTGTLTSGNVVATKMNYDKTTSLTSMTRVVDVTIPLSGTVKVEIGLTRGVTGTAYAQIYKNGVAVGTLRSTTSSNTWTEDIVVTEGDSIAVYVRMSTGDGEAILTDFIIRTAQNLSGIGYTWNMNE